MKILSAIADFIWPRVCAVAGCNGVCDRPGRYICSNCLAALPYYSAPLSCSICGRSFDGAVSSSCAKVVCPDCSEKKPAFDMARSALFYQGSVPNLIEDFKYRKGTWLAEDFSDIAEGAILSLIPWREIDVVVPVPLHRERFNERGYNQSGLLAESLGARLQRRFDGTSFVRSRDTEHQARLSGAGRRKNLRGAFTVCAPEMLRSRKILLVDDVMTTGSTLDECAATLKKSGASKVWCFTLARSVMD